MAPRAATLLKIFTQMMLLWAQRAYGYAPAMPVSTKAKTTRHMRPCKNSIDVSFDGSAVVKGVFLPLIALKHCGPATTSSLIFNHLTTFNFHLSLLPRHTATTPAAFTFLHAA